MAISNHSSDERASASRAVAPGSSESLPGILSLTWALWRKLTAVRRRQFFALLALMFVASVAEVCSVAAVLPFLAALTSPERVFTHPMAQPFIQLLGIGSPQQLILPFTVLFCVAALFAGAIRLALLYANAYFSYTLGADLSIDVYRRTLYQPYPVHIARNSSEIINGIVNKTNAMIGGVLVPLLTLFSAAILLGGILIGLLAIDPAIAVGAGLVCGTIYWVILRLTRRSLRRNSESISAESDQMVRSLQEGLGGIRDVLIDGTQETFCRIYQQADRAVRRAQGYNTFISASPRYLIETIGMILIASVAYGVSQKQGGLLAAIPVLGALALGAQRLLPILQQAYSSVVSIRGNEASLRDVLALLDQPLPTDRQPATPIAFEREITVNRLDFRYSAGTPQVLRGIGVTIRKGQRVGFIGVTGSGKSTLLDVVMGLLSPSGGTLSVDGVPVGDHNRRGWQAHLAHVPQNIFLADTSIAENIAFGVAGDEIDMVRVRESARQAQIADVVEGWPEGYATSVGERGVRLSGGQRQRIGIARALYKRADVIIFDEATSALDNETERALMSAIEQLGKNLTILIIAHRLTTLKACDLVVELANGAVSRSGRYEDLVTA